jgi:alpha-galactosidase
VLFNFSGDEKRTVILESQIEGEWCDYWTGEQVSLAMNTQCRVELSAGLISHAVLFKAKR